MDSSSGMEEMEEGISKADWIFVLAMSCFKKKYYNEIGSNMALLLKYISVLFSFSCVY